MSQIRLFRSVVVGVLLVLVPVAGTANAQGSNPSVAVATCVGGPRALTKQENSIVNDYEILVAKANSHHTAVPDLSPDVAALIACTSGGSVAPTPAPPSTSPSASSSSSTASSAVATCVGGPRTLTKQENSIVNDYEILVAKANSQHTPVPALSPDVAALIACSTGGGVAPTPASAAPSSTSPSATTSTAASAAATCVGGPRALTKQENSMVNDYEILLAKANSHHTAVPALSPDVAALIACS